MSEKRESSVREVTFVGLSHSTSRVTDLELVLEAVLLGGETLVHGALFHQVLGHACQALLGQDELRLQRLQLLGGSLPQTEVLMNEQTDM